jgi:hypothetical protein
VDSRATRDCQRENQTLPKTERQMTQRNKRGLAAWQTRWVTLHDDLHLLEVLLEAITAGPEYMTEYWSLSADVLNFGQDLREAYELELAIDGKSGSDDVFFTLRRRLTLLQARAQTLSLDTELE